MSDFNKYGNFFYEYSNKNNSRSEHDNNSSYKKMELKRKNKRKRMVKSIIKLLFACALLSVVIAVIAVSVSHCSDKKPSNTDSVVADSSYTAVSTVNADSLPFPKAKTTSFTVALGNHIDSKNAILIDTSNNTVLAEKAADETIYPASMTKVMTLLVAAENVDSISGTFKMTSEIIDPLYLAEATLAGFRPNEEVKVIDMFYGMVLKSGAEAAVGLAVYIAGSEEKFVEMMNAKANKLGLTSTHFCNTSGLHDENHYTTCHEMAVIMQAALNNDFCRQILSTEYYTVSANSFHEEITFHSGMFTRMYGNEPEVATIKGGKTGYTVNSANCLVSYAVTDDNREIICVTANGGGKYVPIYDCIEMYKNYTHPALN